MVTEESYTSKASFLDLDNIPTYQEGVKHTFSGKRIIRGLYKSADGRMINADVNGSYNIMRKAVPNA
ncbi:transposase, partial [Anabaena sp. CS-542/02]|nr:transposase [Anabaena sp. CS-542/02]